jgi:hypothetical protein
MYVLDGQVGAENPSTLEHGGVVPRSDPDGSRQLAALRDRSPNPVELGTRAEADHA